MGCREEVTLLRAGARVGDSARRFGPARQKMTSYTQARATSAAGVLLEGRLSPLTVPIGDVKITSTAHHG